MVFKSQPTTRFILTNNPRQSPGGREWVDHTRAGASFSPVSVSVNEAAESQIRILIELLRSVCKSRGKELENYQSKSASTIDNKSNQMTLKNSRRHLHVR